MFLEDLTEHLKKGRGEQQEYFECRFTLDYRMFDTVCGFLNSKGGLIVLGIAGEGNIRGIDSGKVDIYIREIIKASNDPALLNPPFILNPEKFLIDGKNLIAIWVPISSQVHKYSNTIFTRVKDRCRIRSRKVDLKKVLHISFFMEMAKPHATFLGD